MEKCISLCFRFHCGGRRWAFELGESEWLTTSISNSCVKALTSHLLENLFYWLQSTFNRCAIQECVSSFATYQLMAVTGGESSSFNLIKKVAYSIISFVGMSECVLSTDKKKNPISEQTRQKPASLPCLLTSYLLISDRVHTLKIWSIQSSLGTSVSPIHTTTTGGFKLSEFCLKIFTWKSEILN